jgi:ABC-2 type transport system permease protein
MSFAFQSTGWKRSFERLLSGNGYVAEEFVSALTVAVVMLIPQVSLLMPLYTTLVGGDLVAKEYEEGTLRMMLSRPVSRFRLLLVKWLAGVLFSMLLVLVLGVIALGVARLLFPWKSMFVFNPGVTFSVLSAHDGFIRYLAAHGFMAINAGVMFSLAFMFSCFNIKPAAATVVALTVLLASLVLEAIPAFDVYENWLVTHHFKTWLHAFQSPVPWSQIAQSEIILLGVAMSCFLVGCTAFQVRDIKS